MSNDVTPKINALLDAFDSNEGISLLIQALADPVREVRETARWLLAETNSEAAKQALRNYPYAQMQLLHTITGRGWGENYFAISTDKKVLLSNCHSQLTGYAIATVNVWSLQTGELTDTLYVRHEHLGTGQDGQIIVTSFQPFVTVHKDWDMKPQRWGRLLQDLPTDIASLAVSSDGSVVAGGGYQHDAQLKLLGRIAVWDLQADQLIHLLEWKPTRYTSRLLPMMISPDTSLLLSQDKDRLDLHRLWNLQTGELIHVFETSPYWFADAIAKTSDGRCIASGIRDNSVKVWDLIPIWNEDA